MRFGLLSLPANAASDGSESKKWRLTGGSSGHRPLPGGSALTNSLVLSSTSSNSRSVSISQVKLSSSLFWLNRSNSTSGEIRLIALTFCSASPRPWRLTSTGSS